MSSLIFATDETQVLVATDTLAVTPNGAPLMFVSKAVHIPHLKTIIAGTGAGGFANRWSLTVSTRMILSGIENLDYHTPHALRNLWSEFRNEYEIADNITTTVYQFGISESTNNVVSFAYRSTTNFASERLQYGIAVKPECRVLEGNLIEAIPKMMQEQREIQDRSPRESRLYIGGEIQALHLTMDGCNSFKIGEFPDCSTQRRAILENYSREQQER